MSFKGSLVDERKYKSLQTDAVSINSLTSGCTKVTSPAVWSVDLRFGIFAVRASPSIRAGNFGSLVSQNHGTPQTTLFQNFFIIPMQLTAIRSIARYKRRPCWPHPADLAGDCHPFYNASLSPVMIAFFPFMIPHSFGRKRRHIHIFDILLLCPFLHYSKTWGYRFRRVPCYWYYGRMYWSQRSKRKHWQCSFSLFGLQLGQ